jgi:phosphopantetheine adenylyltransferase
MHQVKEVDTLSAKMDLLMKKLDERDQQKKEVMHIHDSCGRTGHIGSNCPKV